MVIGAGKANHVVMSLWSVFNEGETMKNETMVQCYRSMNHVVFCKNDFLGIRCDEGDHVVISNLTTWSSKNKRSALKPHKQRDGPTCDS